MPELRLARLPDRTPVKVTIILPPSLHQALQDYARVYAAAYGQEEPIAELIPAILASYLDGDRAFARARDSLRDSEK